MFGSYIIPANSKKQGLIFGFLKPFDLGLLIGGLSLSFILLTIIPVTELLGVIITLLPLCITGLLVFPLPNYHNVRTLIIDIFNFYMNRRKYVWRGWCNKYEQSDK